MIEVKLSIVVPHDLQYVIVEDPLPGGRGGDGHQPAHHQPDRRRAADTQEKRRRLAVVKDWWWTPTHTELRDEKVALFATELAPGTYEFTYQIRASLPGKFLTLPPTAYADVLPGGVGTRRRERVHDQRVNSQP